MSRIRLVLATAGAAVLAVAGTAFASPTPTASAAPAAPTAGPSASELLAKAQSGCDPASNGKYATDEGGAETISICANGSAYTWTSDLDIDCDGVTTDRCNSSTDPAYQDQTSFQTSTGEPFTADVTHFYVIPLPSSRFDYGDAGISPGSVAAVVYNDKVVYAVFADEGPDSIIGEASYATAQALGIDPDPATGGTEGPVTFIVFPGDVPSPVEDNGAIDSVGASSASAWLGEGATR
ncbi:glycoside hydrolase family 75 protein [Streptomyces sp. NPDC050560]|uniref:glycoside hydrolase family 75 protein n=1 Tax=Streptomyces sp. NPDC050560 TaxID=3365630 RepID=UPI0037B3419B